jgi:hypothetical protein
MITKLADQQEVTDVPNSWFQRRSDSPGAMCNHISGLLCTGASSRQGPPSETPEKIAARLAEGRLLCLNSARLADA